MSSDLILEVLCEQLPTKTIKSAHEYILPRIDKEFSSRRISCDAPKVFATSHRIILIACNVSQNSSNGRKEIKGPRISSDKEVISGFLRKVGKSGVEELEIREVSGEKFYYSSSVLSSKDLTDELTEVIQCMIENFPLHKRMRWGTGTGYWVRPVINVLCVLDGKVLPVSVAGITANNRTFGNLRFSNRKYTVTKAAEYLNFLSENMVIVDVEARRKHILEQLNEQISGTELTYDQNAQILEDMSSNLEYPKVLIGSVDKNFSEIPTEVVSCVMTNHQRYLAIKDQSGKIVKFASAASVVNNMVIKNHEKVLRARLSDALFLIKKDKEHNMDYYVGLLSGVVFKSGLGTLLDKAERISALAKYCSVWIPRSSMLNTERAAMISKADLATLVVREFPELQGKIGRYYAKHSGEEEEVCVAIEEHYLPIGQKDHCPKSPIGIAVSIADKVDSLVGLMATENISGSRDPFALRRTSISLLRVMIENSVSIPLDLMVSKAVSMYMCKARLNKNEGRFLRVDRDALISTILSFCYDRLKVILKESDLDKEVVDAIVGTLHDIPIVKKKVEVICSFLKTEKGKSVITAYRRANNIISKESFDWKLDGKSNKRLCKEDCEIQLYNQIQHYKKLLGSLIKEDKFLEAMESLFEFSSFVNIFMDGVRVCDKMNTELYRNRTRLLVSSVSIYNTVLDFSKIHGTF
ncbi:glycyl-tRNA synthetase subunit beta [Anaplasma marginale str. Dawn]|uniref:glycine--tRNA ligase subunit beta n=1 Tax=Anaplasma marginale TaxID=770 RepID=UPI0003C27D94|nr:glycine--tRNA ligase subunit beta [Anaplasma marginale]AGZ79254.1 glycyl-tRNA synthetase subunit beta [Anaplasma marginale str. Gypsy Plains]AGZ80048.1 glycyl-tRNA synthetase subunit beta [Anaplasma marginale str. Dawn]